MFITIYDLRKSLEFSLVFSLSMGCTKISTSHKIGDFELSQIFSLSKQAERRQLFGWSGFPVILNFEATEVYEKAERVSDNMKNVIIQKPRESDWQSLITSKTPVRVFVLGVHKRNRVVEPIAPLVCYDSFDWKIVMLRKTKKSKWQTEIKTPFFSLW